VLVASHSASPDARSTAHASDRISSARAGSPASSSTSAAIADQFVASESAEEKLQPRASGLLQMISRASSDRPSPRGGERGKRSSPSTSRRLGEQSATLVPSSTCVDPRYAATAGDERQRTAPGLLVVVPRRPAASPGRQVEAVGSLHRGRAVPDTTESKSSPASWKTSCAEQLERVVGQSCRGRSWQICSTRARYSTRSLPRPRSSALRLRELRQAARRRLQFEASAHSAPVSIHRLRSSIARTKRSTAARPSARLHGSRPRRAAACFHEQRSRPKPCPRSK
jgi:hypothetical protein